MALPFVAGESFARRANFGRRWSSAHWANVGAAGLANGMGHVGEALGANLLCGLGRRDVQTYKAGHR